VARLGGATEVSAACATLGIEAHPERCFRVITEAPTHASTPSEVWTPNLDGGPPGHLDFHLDDRPLPHTLGDVLCFAADLDRLDEIEATARACAAALAPWCWGPLGTVLAWRFLAVAPPSPRQPGIHLAAALDDSLEQALEDAGVTPSELGPKPRAVRWAEACRRGLRVPASLDDPYFAYGALGAPPVPPGVQGQPFADLPDPTAPVGRLTELGYALEGADAQVIVLLAGR